MCGDILLTGFSLIAFGIIILFNDTVCVCVCVCVCFCFLCFFVLIDDRLYSAILRSLEQTHCARAWFYMSDWLFIARFSNIHRSGVLTALAWLVPHVVSW